MTKEEISAFGKGGLESPPSDWIPITPHDTNDLPYVARAIMNRGDETVSLTVRTVGGDSNNRLITIPAGEWVPGLFTRVLASGSDADPTISGAV